MRILCEDQNITARMINEHQIQLLWFTLPNSICTEQLKLLSFWCQKNEAVLDEIERKTSQQFIGFQHKAKNFYSMGDLKTFFDYASTIVNDQKIHIDDKNIIGCTLEDMLKSKQR